MLLITRRHDEIVMEARETVLRGIGRVVNRRVVTDAHELDALQSQHAIRLGPAPIVAERDADQAPEGSVHAKPFRAGLEVLALEVLERPPRLRLLVAGQVHLAKGRDNAPVTLDENRQEVMRWNIRRAWPSRWTGPGLNAKNNEIAMETLEICHEGLKLDT